MVALENRSSFTLDAYRKVAWDGAAPSFSSEALTVMAEARAAFLRLIEQPGVVIYGVTSGYGQRAYLRFTPEERKAHAQRPSYPPQTLTGAPLPNRLARGMVFARLTNFVEGNAAITPSLAEAVASMLGPDKVPEVPADGHGGAGEILPLSHLFLDLMKRSELGEKDVLSLINGSPCAAAVVADGALSARSRLRTALEIFSLSAEALKAPMEAYDAALEGLWGDDDEAAVLKDIRHYLEGGLEERRAFQAPVSFRITPRLLARFRRSVREAERAACVSLQSITDNPVYVPPTAEYPDGRALSNGGYHNAMAAPALDELAAAMADLALLAERQTSKILDGRYSGLPDQLLSGPEDGRYLGCTAMASTGLGEQARRAAQTTFLPGPESGGYGQNDVSSNAIPAWRSMEEAARCFDGTLAILALVASQAFFATEREAPKNLRAVLEEVRRIAPPFKEGEPPSPRIQALHRHFSEKAVGETSG